MRRTVRWLRGFAPGVAAGLLAAPWFWGASGPRPAEAAAGFAGPVVRVAPGERGTAGDRLDDPLPAVWYDGLAFGAVVDNLRNASGANIYVDWGSLPADVHRDLPVTLACPAETFSRRLERILHVVGGDRVVLGAVVDKEVVFVSWSAALQADLVVRVYDVRHLVRPEHRQADVAALVRRARGVDPLSWQGQRPNGLLPASITERAGHLIVSHAGAVQDRIAAALADPGFGHAATRAAGGSASQPARSMAWAVTRPARPDAPALRTGTAGGGR